MRRIELVLLALLSIWAFLVYRYAFSIPFLYTEVEGIALNPVVQDSGIFFQRMISWKGLVQRPLSVLSYNLNYLVGTTHVWGYHLVNLIIHIVNIWLLFIFARRKTKHYWMATTIFALHPLASAGVAQLFGRPYGLATMFLLLALERLSRRQKEQVWTAKEMLIYSFLFALMLLSKQGFVFFPALLLWHEYIYGNLKFSMFRRSSYVIFIAGSAIVVVLILLIFYAIPLSETAPFGPGISLLSQLGNFPTLAKLYVLPFQLSFIHDLPFYATMWKPEVILSAFVVVLCAWITFRYRHSDVGFFLGALVITLIPTNSILPKNEVIREWRLYPSLIFFSLLVAECWKLVEPKLPKKVQWACVALFVLYIGMFCLTIDRQNLAYQSSLSTWKSVLEKYPNSANAANFAGIAIFDEQGPQVALPYFLLAKRLAPYHFGYAENAANAYGKMGENEKAAEERELAKQLAEKYGRMPMTWVLIQ